MNKKNTTKKKNVLNYPNEWTPKTRNSKDIHPEKEVMDCILQIHKREGWREMLYLWKVGKWFGISCWTFYPKIRRRYYTIFSSRECSRFLLPLQYKSRGEFIRVLFAIGPRKSSDAIFAKRNNLKSKRKLVSR